VGVGKTIVEQRRTPFLEHYKDGNILALRTMSERVRDALGEEDVVLTDSPAIVRHFSGRRAANAKLLHRWSRLDPSWIATMRSEPQRVFVIAPMRNELSERLRDQLRLEPSQTIAEVARGDGTPLPLHTVR